MRLYARRMGVRQDAINAGIDGMISLLAGRIVCCGCHMRKPRAFLVVGASCRVITLWPPWGCRH